MADATPVAVRALPDTSRTRAGQDAASAQHLHDRVVSAFGDIYLVGHEIGRGGMAVVYSATDVRLQRTVALKVLPPDLAFRAEVRERFVREAQTAARLNHPHIVPIYAVHEAEGMVCFSMALIDGETLAGRIAREPQPPIEYVARVLEQSADALAYAHASGVVHRDIKPDNILIDRVSGRVMVTDFGIARAAEAGSRLTQTGIAVGTPAFMSPEQATADIEIDGRSDLYSLGVVGYLMLAARLPFEASTTPAMLIKHLSETPWPLSRVRSDVPDVLSDIIAHSLEKQPVDRWTNAMAMRDALRLAMRSGFATKDNDDARPARSAARANDVNGDTGTDRARDVMRDAIWRGTQKVGARHDDWSPRPSPESSPPMPTAALAAPAAPYPMRSMLPLVPPLPQGANRHELREWKRSMRDMRDEQRERWKLERDGHRDELSYDATGRTADERLARYRTRMIGNVGVIGMLITVNLLTTRFPWAIFPTFGIGMGMVTDMVRMRGRGYSWSQVFGSMAESPEVVPVDDVATRPSRIAGAVRGFRSHLKWAAGGVLVAGVSLVIGADAHVRAMIVPFVGAGAFALLNASLAARSWFRLRTFGVSAGDALGAGWEQQAIVPDTRPRDVRIREVVERIASTTLLASRYGATVKGAVDDHFAIRETSERLSPADRELVPDVAPTADALLERIGALAGALERLDDDVPENAVGQLNARIAAIDAERVDSPDRERRLSLLQRQQASLADLSERRAVMSRQLDSASMALRSLRLDMVKLRTLGVGAAIADVTHATQEARALSRDIANVVDAAEELRGL